MPRHEALTLTLARGSVDLAPAAQGEIEVEVAATGLNRADIDHFLCHPGGTKVIDALEDVIGRGTGSLDHSRAVLRDFGNMSAVTVVFVLDRFLRMGGGGRSLMTAVGPGFTAGFLILDGT